MSETERTGSRTPVKGYILIGLLISGLGLHAAARIAMNAQKPPQPAFIAIPAVPSCPAIDINTASAEELMLLPGIGPGRARDIIEYRTIRGKFTHVEEIMNVKGIGEKTFSSLSGLLRVSQ